MPVAESYLWDDRMPVMVLLSHWILVWLVGIEQAQKELPDCPEVEPKLGM